MYSGDSAQHKSSKMRESIYTVFMFYIFDVISTATCGAALELPNLNYVHGTELNLKPKDK